MPMLSRFTSLLRNLTGRRGDDALDSEVQGYVDMLVEEKMRAGMNPEDARRAARLEAGGVEQVKEQVREVRAGAWLEILAQDLRYGLRMLVRNPGSTAVAVLTLALGIGANTAIFSVIDTALLRPLPYPNPDRIVMLYGRTATGDMGDISPADFLDYQKEVRSFEHLAAFRENSFNLAGEDRPERVAGTVVTPEFFAVIGKQTQLGRTLVPEQDQPGGPRTMVLSYSLWQRRYGGDPSIIGKSIYLDGTPRIVVGVMPQNFQFPGQSELWASALHAVPDQPLNPTADLSTDRDAHYFATIGRLRAGVTLKQADSETSTIARRLKQQYPVEEDVDASAISLHEDLVGETRPEMLMLLGAVSLLLLIACANVASIQLARGASRQKEITIRRALGASRARLVRQLLTECVLLAVVGGGIGIFLARLGLVPLRSLVPPEVIGGAELGLDSRVLAFTIVASLGSAILFGLLPALHLASPDLNGVLKEGGRGASGSLRAQQIRRVLVVSEIALAAMLLIGAGLLIRSFGRLLSAPEGFQPQGVLSLQVSLPQARYPNPADRALFVAHVIDQISTLPGIASASAISRLPLNPGNSTRNITIEGRTIPPADDLPLDYLVATPAYFQTIGTPLIAGRVFNERDVLNAPGVVIVSQTAAQQYWPGENPVGKHVTIGACGDDKTWCEVVGVVADVRQHHLNQKPAPTVYVSYAQDPWPFMAFIVRTRMDPSSAASAVEGAIHAVDKDQAVYNVRAMTEVIRKSVSSERLRMSLLGLFAIVALTLACVGIYGVMAYSVVQRTHEIGIRLALGARPSGILQLIIRQGLTLALFGCVLGLAGAFAVTHLLSAMLYGVSPRDATIFAGIPLLLLLVAFLASYIPARRAMQVDPMVALRYE
jgi:predicted permease